MALRWRGQGEDFMKACPYCMNENVPDAARKCPSCGSWLSKMGVVRKVVEVVGWVFVSVFILGLASCGLMLVF